VRLRRKAENKIEGGVAPVFGVVASEGGMSRAEARNVRLPAVWSGYEAVLLYKTSACSVRGLKRALPVLPAHSYSLCLGISTFWLVR